jgi:hypothetical protein
MSPDKLNLIVYSLADEVRERLCTAATEAGYQPRIKKQLIGLKQPAKTTLILLHFGERDIEPVDRVNDFHRRWDLDRFQIIGIISKALYERNPQLGCWLINRRPALMTLWFEEDLELHLRMLPTVLKRFRID